MSEEQLIKKPKFVGKKYLIINIISFIIGFILMFINYEIDLNVPTPISEIGFGILMFSIVFFPFTLCFGFLGAKADKYVLPLPTRIQPEEPQTYGPNFTIYFTLYKKKKVRGYLDGNTVFYKDHKTILGTFDDSNPDNIEFITSTKRVCDRIVNGTIQYAEDNSKLGTINNFKLIPEKRGYPARLQISPDNLKGEIIATQPSGEENFALIEGDMRKMDDVRFYAILTFIFEIFC